MDVQPRWALRSQAYDFEIFHRKGKQHIVPDPLSRAVASIDVVNYKITKDVWYQKLRELANDNSHIHDDLRIENDILFKLLRTKSADHSEWKVCAPKEYQKEIIQSNQDEVKSGRFGRFKTLSKMSRYYQWPRMKVAVSNYIRICMICKTVKPVNFQTKIRLQERVGYREYEKYGNRTSRTVIGHIITDLSDI